MVLKKKEQESISAFLSKKYPDCLTAILSGSIIDGTADMNSDLDIVLIVPNRNLLYNETLQFENYVIQTFIIPLQHLYERLYSDFINAKCNFIGLLEKGKHLYGDMELTKAILHHSNKLKQIGPKPISSKVNLGTRIRLTQLINKLSNTNEQWENLILNANELADLLIGFKLHSEGSWKGDGKHRMKFIENHNPNFKKQVIEALEVSYKNRDYTRLIEVSKNEVERKGGLVNIYSKDRIQLTPHENFICIHIKFLGDYEKRKKTIWTLHKSLLKLKIELPTGYSHYFHSVVSSLEQDFSDKDVFCIVHGSNEWLTNFLMEKLYVIKEQNDLNDVSFPIFLNPKFKFISNTLYKKVSPIFIKLSMSCFDEKKELYDEGFQLSSAISILKALNQFYFINRNPSYESFLISSFKYYFMYSYDNKERITTKELVRRYEKSLLQFESTYQTQKTILEELWENINSIVEEDLQNLIENIYNIEHQINIFPSYMDAFPKEKTSTTQSKKTIFLRELASKCMETLLIEASYIPYIFYLTLRLRQVSFEPKDLYTSKID